MNKKLIILQLNELNFDYAKYYIYKYNLKSFQKLLKFTRCETSSEITYQKLEPWIQWVTFNTGKTADEHGIFRLGEANQIKFKQIYERVEELGFKVGAITPMNTKNNLKNPTFFISDPWTKTKGGKNYFENILSSCLSRIALPLNISSFFSFSEAFSIFSKTFFGKSFFLATNQSILVLLGWQITRLSTVFFISDIQFCNTEWVEEDLKLCNEKLSTLYS